MNTEQPTSQSTSQATSSEGRDKLVNDLKTVIKDAEELLRSTGQQMDSTIQSARARFESTLQNAKTSLGGAQGKLADQGKDAMEVTQKYVQENPWQSVGIGAVAGVLIGILLSRK
ncbi:MAG: hypothetical protein JWR25_2314 [Noviherbaspirillum sp.]|jgi:ElaB/YqjD/DUF883 family membrane-anchored ribosome-binding protein|nr:hypothetical protein [Noviherbaspirillum sp.]MDB5795935.1 hypothetical protein [Noviherbaspirillum sp.]